MSKTRELWEMAGHEADKVLVGMGEPLRQVMIGLLVGGHVLLEGVPGTAKTLLARTVAHLVSGEFKRVQFTPDLMPSDIVGTNVFDFESRRFHLRAGPVFTNILLADEINRAPAKTQAALLEAMEERQVTLDGERHPLPDLFMVMATQNPVEYEGTYPLPEAQLDRFFCKVLIDYGEPEVEREVLRRYHSGFDPRDLAALGLRPVLDPEAIRGCRLEIKTVVVADGIIDYIGRIATASRRSRDLVLGASPRASIALLLGSKARAALEGRDYVVPDDVKALVPPVLRHRVILRAEAEVEGMTADTAIERFLAGVEVPR